MSVHEESLEAILIADVLNANNGELEPGRVGAVSLPSLSTETVTALVRSALDFAAKQFGDAGADLILQHKAEIRTIVGPALLEFVDTVVHGLQDPKFNRP